GVNVTPGSSVTTPISKTSRSSGPKLICGRLVGTSPNPLPPKPLMRKMPPPISGTSVKVPL
ncbi:MAG: hypothetical protein AAF656_11460, partial [Planctomycetota bacterium]